MNKKKIKIIMLKMFALIIGTCAIFWIFLLNECKIMIG